MEIRLPAILKKQHHSTYWRLPNEPMSAVIEFPQIWEELPAEILESEAYELTMEDIHRLVSEGEELLAEEAMLRRQYLFAGRALTILGWAWTAYEAWALLDELSVEGKRLKQNEEVRKVKTSLCANRAIRVLEIHRRFLEQGRFNGLEMQTRDDAERNTRKFKSRA